MAPALVAEFWAYIELQAPGVSTIYRAWLYRRGQNEAVAYALGNSPDEALRELHAERYGAVVVEYRESRDE